MRSACCALAVLLVVGCRSQSAPISNPFLSPDRVPPPATRSVLPGTAQPYYPGDPAPTLAPGGAPTTNPGNVFPPVQANPTTPTTLPGGWNAQPPTYPAQPQPQQGSASRYNVNPSTYHAPAGPASPSTEPAIQVQTDNESLRFGPAPQQQFPTYASSTVPGQTNPLVVPAGYQEVQPSSPSSTVGSQRHQAPDVLPSGSTMSNQVAPLQQPVETTRAVSIRPVNSSVSRDGFRPQGSRRKERAAQEMLGQAAATPREFGPLREAVDRFGFDPQYQWLRGQLQYSAATNQWHLRYVPIQGQTDQFGGQLLISNPQVLGELQPGTHVQVQGKLQMQQTATGASIPAYVVTVVQRQR